ncbi:hypothetical protein PoB_002879000 [Plakobranchus ocellatus]|uniref:Nucleolar protein 10 n=1 Tax=Plakobranchus ocellatus TaxID=259542 RepID=A0AAV4A4F6_9GAST|nr:hypothetical protein PoB_002879000 [Plakobranchus ocellatus]
MVHFARPSKIGDPPSDRGKQPPSSKTLVLQGQADNGKRYAISEHHVEKKDGRFQQKDVKKYGIFQRKRSMVSEFPIG